MSQTATTPPVVPPQHAPRHEHNLIIRPWPKVVFLYPTFAVSTVFWLVSLVSTSGSTTGVTWLGNVFMIVFGLNLLVFSFDFSRIKSITILLGIVAVVLGIGWANTQWGWFEGIKNLFASVDIRMNTQFFGFVSGILAFILAVVLVNSRFNYYEINHRELMHHHGYLGDITRIPTAGLLVQKEIYDLLEYLLLRSGRLVFYPQGKREAIVVDNVIHVNRVEECINDLLSVVAVREMPDDEPPAVEH